MRAYRQGIEAWWRGLKPEHCPYLETTKDGKQWLRGWHNAANSSLAA